MNENVENQPDYMHGNITGHGNHRYPVSKGSGVETQEFFINVCSDRMICGWKPVEQE